MRYVLDTNIFNWLLDGRIARSDLPVDGDLVIAPLQAAELDACRDLQRRADLRVQLSEIAPIEVPGESFCFDVPGAGFDQAKWSDRKTFSLVFDALEASAKKRGNRVDALIGEIALKNSWILLTADKELADAVLHCGGLVRLFRVPAGN